MSSPNHGFWHWLRDLFRGQNAKKESRSPLPASAVSAQKPSQCARLSQEERSMLQQATRGMGRWYVCRQNHPYLVGNCGVPTQAAMCPTCGDRIGAHNGRYQLVAGNKSVADPFAIPLSM